MEIVEGPAVVTKPERLTAGIRTVTAFRGMFAVRDKLMDELFERLDDWGVDFGPVFFRLHVVNMQGAMDVEVGAVTAEPVRGDDRIRPGILPAGRYAALTYVNHGRRANGTLIDWARDRGLSFDCAEDPGGDAFACRYEAYLTDPRTERK
ncbi:GyrI-like domain-containing protein [Actinoplanes philippinensis]|uniref:GyrI-like domain-containing protein n=1 Tax=Actinoplanes philippinensis TaxID=35752 RepID=UPI0033C3B3AB